MRLPHPLVLLTACVLLGAATTWVLPAGEYDRREDEATGRTVVVGGTYHAVEAAPVGLFAALVAIPHGMADAGEVLFFIFLVGGAFAVLESTGALQRAIAWLLHNVGDRQSVFVATSCVLFGTGGVLFNMQEEIIGLIPILLLLARRLGADPMTAAAMSLGSAGVGAAFSPVNPFQVTLAQSVAELPLMSGWQFRSVFLVIGMAVWTLATVRLAARRSAAPTPERAAKEAAEDEISADDQISGRDAIVIAVFIGSMSTFVYGTLSLGWGFDRMSALFFAMGTLVGLVSGKGLNGTAEALGEGFRAMTSAAIMVGLARTVYIVLEQGRVVDTLVHGLFLPIEQLPLALSALGLMGAHILVHVPISSVSGQAVLTTPVAVPVADLLGMSRQVAVLAYQYGAGLTDLVTPTNGSMMAVLAAAGVRYDEWIRFTAPQYLLLLLVGAVGLLVAVGIGF